MVIRIDLHYYSVYRIITMKLKKIFCFNFTRSIKKMYDNPFYVKYFHYTWNSFDYKNPPSTSRFMSSIVRSQGKNMYPRLFSGFPRGNRNKRLKSVQNASSRFHDGFAANSLNCWHRGLFLMKEEIRAFHSETSKKAVSLQNLKKFS